MKYLHLCTLVLYSGNCEVEVMYIIFPCHIMPWQVGLTTLLWLQPKYLIYSCPDYVFAYSLFAGGRMRGGGKGCHGDAAIVVRERERGAGLTCRWLGMCVCCVEMD